ncbi:MAG TPA: Gfo/Idh/MocA family oxidoreductase [Acidimicrobiales bacterium]|nr:Gfo/Idh/MocA family oxidoreductase [Acidimicrobiales bacterium]
MDELRFGIIGTGMMGCEHIGNLDALAGATVTALSDPNPDSLAGAATFVDSSVAQFTDHRDLLASGLVDAAIVASPNHTHRSVLDDCWGTGIAVFIEKPLCTTVVDALAVQRAAADHDALVWMGLEYRYFPAVGDLIGEVRAGTAGRVQMVTVREHRYPFLVKVDNWNRFSANTGGTLVEKCCHFFDLMNQVTGTRPVRVLASGGQNVNHLGEVYDGRRSDILDNAFVIVDYPDGVRALLDLCMFAEGSRWEQDLTVVGDTGKIEAHVPGFAEVARGAVPELVIGSRGPDWPVATRTIDYGEVGHLGTHHGSSFIELERFADAIRTGSEAAVTIEDGVWSVAMGVAAHRSIDEGRPVELAEFDLGA